MITHGKNIKVFSANANQELAEAIAKKLGVELGDAKVLNFSDGEIGVNINETVRGQDVFIVQSTSYPVNDHLMELLIMIDACKRASAGRITAVMPYYGYARQDRKAKARDPISAKLVADLIHGCFIPRCAGRSVYVVHGYIYTSASLAGFVHGFADSLRHFAV